MPGLHEAIIQTVAQKLKRIIVGNVSTLHMEIEKRREGRKSIVTRELEA
jgi:hypothetical protein